LKRVSLQRVLRQLLALALFSACALAFSQSLPLTRLLAQASQLMQAGQFEQAYQSLVPSEAEHAGDVEFDFQLGLAALESGRAARSIFAFERVLAKQPGNLRAKAELARALTQNREPQAAKIQLQEVVAQPLPPQVRQNLERFLAAIDAPQRTQASPVGKDQFQLVAEFSFGYDSNANVGSSQTEWIGAGGLTLYPSASLLGQSSTYLSSSLVGSHSRALSDRWHWSNAASVGHLWNFPRAQSTMTNNFGTLDARSSLSHRIEAQEWSITMLAQQVRLNKDANRNAVGLNAQWQRTTGSHRFAAYGQAFSFSHPGSHQRDTRRAVLGASLVSDIKDVAGMVVSTSIGRESPQALPQFGFHLKNLRVSAEKPLGQRTKVFASTGIEQRDYDGVDPLFAGQIRKDRELDLKFGIELALDKAWSLSPTVTVVRNQSSLAPNDYKRQQFFVFARYRF
jgi:outer membrane protein